MRLSKALLIAAMGLCLFACEKKESDSGKYITSQSETEYAIPEAGETVTVRFETNLEKSDIIVEKAADWLITSLGEGYIRVQVEPNTENEKRSANVTLSAAGVKKPLVLTFSQAANDKYITIVSESEMILDADETSAEIEFETNITEGLSVRVTEQNMGQWLTATLNGNKVSLSAEAETTSYGKDAKVVITNGLAEASVRILRKAGDSTGEKDPFHTESYAMPWQDDWTPKGFTYVYSDCYKYDPIMHGENGLPKCDAGWRVKKSNDKITIGVKLDWPIVDYFEGKTILAAEVNSYLVRRVKFAIVEVAEEENTFMVPEWQRDGLLSQTKVIWESSERAVGAEEYWPKVSIPKIAVPEKNNYMLMAYLEGNPDAIDAGDGWLQAMLLYMPQHMSKIAPQYISLTGNKGEYMFPFTGGTIPFNIYFSL